MRNATRTIYMKLTGRQRQFLLSFLDLYHEAKHPLHYSAVAERLGVSPMTAYDMMRLLRNRGWLVSEYVLPDHGPGRSAVLFRPTEKASALLLQAGSAEWEPRGWEKAKDRILQTLRDARDADYQQLLEAILQRLPELKSPALYVTEMVTAVLLSLHHLKGDAKASGLVENLRTLGLPGELAGLTVGLSFVEKSNRRATQLLVKHSRRYQESLARLSIEARQRLSDFAEEVMTIVVT
jgi:hypothetical protein